MPDQPPSVDSLSQTPAPKTVPDTKGAMETAAVKRWERLLLGILIAFYLLYVVWAFALMGILPSTDPRMGILVPIGVGSALLAAALLIGVGFLLFMRIGQSRTPASTRERSAIKLAIIVTPGLLLSAALAFMITRQPALIVDITKPTSSADFVAPLQISFGLNTSLGVLAQRGFHPIQYKWDINGDGKVDQTTVDPTLTATYDKEGVYAVRVSMIGSDGSVQTASRRFVITQSVFTISPIQPVVEKPVLFSIANLISDPQSIAQVQWDFNGDGKVDSTTTGTPQAANTYFKTGDYKVTAVVDLTNKTEVTYSRTISVVEPPPLPFPVTISTIPSHLIGSPPFAVLFTVNTKEPVAEVDWDFGDGQKDQGQRVAHTYSQNGNYPVQIAVRSQSGVTANLDTAVQVVDPLNLPDLTFTGTPNVQGTKIEGQVPLQLNLTPHTSTQFVTFNWEAPDADEVGSTDTTLQAIYRHPGTYTVTLVGQDLNNHVLRMPITVQVDPPAALATFAMNPESGTSPLTVTFDASATSVPGDDINGFVWNFGDNSQPVTAGATVTHTYTKPQTYTVNLTVQTVSGKSYNASKTLVVRAAALQACFTRSRENVAANQAVQFYSDCTAGSPQSYLWDFGDGAQTDQQNPVHTFTQPGSYTVKLTITDAGGAQNTFSAVVPVQ
ncbi:MAG TPA: PKD domain-containing protein [Candidatus Peribacteraceae bacterium]|nr:PKD domain-containing protein [Candidatus Peribacteraceae bacterium]